MNPIQKIMGGLAIVSLTFLLTVSVILIAEVYVFMLNSDSPDPEPKELVLKDEIIIPTNTEVCADTTLRAPGGMMNLIGTVCYRKDVGWIEFNTSHLLEEDYIRLISPLRVEVRDEAKKMGMYEAWTD